MNLIPPKLPLPDGPVEEFFFALMAADDVLNFSIVFADLRAFRVPHSSLCVSKLSLLASYLHPCLMRA